MKIADYSIQTTSAHKIEQSRDVAEKLKIWSNPREDAGFDEPSFDEPSYKLDIGNQDQFALNTNKTYTRNSIDSESYVDQEAKIKLKLIESFIYHTTGRMIHLQPSVVKIEQNEVVRRLPGDVSAEPNQIPPPPQEDWGLTYDYREVFEEVEQVRFQSAGTVLAAEGREYTFDLAFSMSRSFYQDSNVNIRMGDAAKVDPLVVVYAGGAPKLSVNRQVFDLDADGHSEQIAMPTDGSGFLAMDKNGNGAIDDGSELFGPENGDGFQALRAYDADGNNWIDEADDVFTRLSIMTVDESGAQTMFKLGELGIGAIFLDEVPTPFGIKDNVDDKGAMKSSSVFLRENGTAGTIHHIDLSL